MDSYTIHLLSNCYRQDFKDLNLKKKEVVTDFCLGDLKYLQFVLSCLKWLLEV